LNKYKVLIALVFSLMLLNLSNVKATDWALETVDDSIGGIQNYSSIAVDSEGKVHIAYYDDVGDDLKWAYYNGSSWNIETVDSTGNVGQHCSIVVDSSNTPHISYQDDTNGNIKYATRIGTDNWATETVDDTGKLGDGLGTSIDIDSDSIIHIAYAVECATVEELRYAYMSGATWNIEVVDTSDGVASPSLALDSSDIPHIGYVDPNYFKHAYKKNGSWTVENVEATGGSWLEDVSLALDSSDNPHMVYALGDPRQLKYASKSGTWSSETIETDGAGVCACQNTLFIYSDIPHVAYTFTANYYVKYAVKNGSWSIETVDDNSNFLDVSIAVDTNIHISYHDFTNADLEYATGAIPNNAPTLTFTGETNYENDGVHPDTGRQNSNFTFRIKYTDADNEAPTSIQLWLDEDLDGTYSASEKHNLSEDDASDTDYTDGKIYQLTYQINPSGTMNYKFYTTDGTDTAYSTEKTVEVKPQGMPPPPTTPPQTTTPPPPTTTPQPIIPTEEKNKFFLYGGLLVCVLMIIIIKKR